MNTDTVHHQNATKLAEQIIYHDYPQGSCYSDAIRNLNIDCSSMDPIEQRTISLKFTECFLNITGRGDRFPRDVPDEQKASSMSSEIYNVYNTIKNSCQSLCTFSQQAAFSQDTSKMVLSLLKTVVESFDAANQTKAVFSNYSSSLNGSLNQVVDELNRSTVILHNLIPMFQQMIPDFYELSSKLQVILKYSKSIQFYIVCCAIGCLCAYSIPGLIIPILGITVFFIVIDWKCNSISPTWSASIYRVAFMAVFFTIAVFYPLWKSLSRIFRFVNKVYHKYFKPPSKTQFIRFGKVKTRPTPKNVRLDWFN